MTATILFYIFAAMSGLAAIGVVVSRNIVRMAVWLLFTLLGVGGLYFLLHSEFLAAVQLVVYAGGTLILIIFGVMLTSKSPFSRFEATVPEVIIAVSLACVLMFALVLAIVRTEFNVQPLEIDRYPVDLLGQTLLGDYLIPFELASVLLLAVMIGAAYLAKGRRKTEEKRSGVELSREARRWS